MNRPGGFPWATFTIKVTGCFLIGALMVLVTETWSSRRLLRPFLGWACWGGYTSFSAYLLDVQQALLAGAPRVAVA
jgi:CrcB protein